MCLCDQLSGHPFLKEQKSTTTSASQTTKHPETLKGSQNQLRISMEIRCWLVCHHSLPSFSSLQGEKPEAPPLSEWSHPLPTRTWHEAWHTTLWATLEKIEITCRTKKREVPSGGLYCSIFPWKGRHTEQCRWRVWFQPSDLGIHLVEP